jgi:cytochrome c-type biogenesis protein CcmF
MWILALISIIISLILPIIFHIIYDLDLALEAQYFKVTLIPILILINIIIGFYSYKNLQSKGYIICACAAIASLVVLINYFEIRLLINICAIFSSVFLLLTTVWEFFCKSRSGNIAMLLGHFAYGILTLSIALNSALEKEVDLIGEKFATVQMDNLHIKLEDIKYSYGPNYLRQIVQIKVEDKKSGFIIKLAPENRWYAIENKMTAESSIHSFLNYDLYAVLNRIDGNKVHVKIYYRPYISFIWLGSLLMVISFGISMIDRRRNTG